jgi:predicted Holliday junction resolvase-like endonuclease
MDESSKLIVAGIIILLLIITFVVISFVNYFKKITRERENRIKAQELMLQRNDAELNLIANQRAGYQFELFKNNELEGYKKIMQEAAHQEAMSLYARWIIDEEERLRKDAVTRSMGVNLGKITEHLVPFSSHLEHFNPRDIRFIGSPVDLMIFDGATEKSDVIDIYFVEIKTGTGQLSKKQKAIRDAIDKHRVYWKPVLVPEFKWDIPDDEY